MNTFNFMCACTNIQFTQTNAYIYFISVFFNCIFRTFNNKNNFIFRNILLLLCNFMEVIKYINSTNIHMATLADRCYFIFIESLSLWFFI